MYHMVHMVEITRVPSSAFWNNLIFELQVFFKFYFLNFNITYNKQLNNLQLFTSYGKIVENNLARIVLRESNRK